MFNLMVELHTPPGAAAPPPPDAARLDALFHALADGTRRGMLQRLAGGGRYSISELAAPQAMTFAAVSKHVKALERAGLVRREVQGRTHYCRLEPTAMQQAEAWIARQRAIWEGRLDRMEAYLLALHAQEQQHGQQQVQAPEPAPDHNPIQKPEPDAAGSKSATRQTRPRTENE